MNQSHKADGNFCGSSYFEKISTKITNHGSLTSTPSSIFLMVFIALPALQRSQRDTQRREDMARLASQLNQYQTNNNGRLPNSNVTIAGKITQCNPGGPSVGDINAVSTTEPACVFLRKYMNSATATDGDDSEFIDPLGDAYQLTIKEYAAGDGNNLDFNDKRVYVLTSARCNGESAEATSNSRDYAIMYALEGSGTYCKDSQ